jgi:transcriptional regulator with XRE-family HTH domain
MEDSLSVRNSSSGKTPRATTYAAVVGQILARMRADRRMSQMAVATSLGVVQSVVSRVESGALPLTVDLLARWAALLQVRPGQVLDSAEAAVAALERQGVRVVLRRQKDDESGGLALIGAAAVGALIGLALARSEDAD